MIGLQWKLLRQRFRSTGEISGFPSRGTNRATRTPPLAVGNAGHAESPTVGEIASRNVRRRPAFSGWPRTEQSTNVTGPQKKRFLQIAADGTGIRPDPITPPLLTEKLEAVETEPKKEGSGNVIKSQSSQRPEQP